MIQRIQTLYLLAVAALTGVLLFVPLADFADGGSEYRLFAFGLRDAAGETVVPTLYMGIVIALAAALALLIVVLYKRRMVQLRLCVAEAVLLVGAQIFAVIHYLLAARMVESFSAFHTQSFRFAIALPVAALILDLLAARAIFRDEMLVRSLDRIR